MSRLVVWLVGLGIVFGGLVVRFALENNLPGIHLVVLLRARLVESGGQGFSGDLSRAFFRLLRLSGANAWKGFRRPGGISLEALGRRLLGKRAWVLPNSEQPSLNLGRAC